MRSLLSLFTIGGMLLTLVCMGCCPQSIWMVRSSHVVANSEDAMRYESLNPHFAKAFGFLRRKNLAELPVGRYEIDGDNCWAMVQEVNLTPLDGSAKVEAHRKYIDIQSPITGDETIGQMTMDAERLALPFDEKKDIELFT